MYDQQLKNRQTKLIWFTLYQILEILNLPNLQLLA